MSNDQQKDDIKTYLSEQFNLSMEQIDAMLPDFITTLHSHMVNLEKSVAEKNMERIGKSAHTIKGALLNLGLEHSADIAYLIEKSGKSNDTSVDYDKMINTLRVRLSPLLNL
jgi:HPt (histidine-containing phosphotransfer) domain-containing protein